MLSAIGIAIKHCPVTGRPPCSPFGPLPIAALNGALRALIRPAAREYFRAVPDAEPAQDAAAFGIGGPLSRAWREELLTRAGELGGLKSWIVARGDHDERASGLHSAIDAHLSVVRETAAERGRRRIGRLWHGVTGAPFERTLVNLDAKCQSTGLNGCSPRHLAPRGGRILLMT